MSVLRNFLLVLFLLLSIRIYSGKYDSAVTSYIQNSLVAFNVPCHFLNSEITFPVGIKLERVFCQIKNNHFAPGKNANISLSQPSDSKQFSELGFNELTAHIYWRGLIKLSPGIVLNGKIPGATNEVEGKFSLILARAIFSGRNILELKLTDVSLEQISKLNLATGANISGRINSEIALNFTSNNDMLGEGVVKLTQGAVSAAMGNNSIIKLPSISELSLRSAVVVTNDRVTLDKIVGSFNYGEIGGSISIDKIFSKLNYSLNGELALNELGMKSIAGFIAMAAGGDVAKPAEEWVIEGSVRWEEVRILRFRRSKDGE